MDSSSWFTLGLVVGVMVEGLIFVPLFNKFHKARAAKRGRR